MNVYSEIEQIHQTPGNKQGNDGGVRLEWDSVKAKEINVTYADGQGGFFLSDKARLEPLAVSADMYWNWNERLLTLAYRDSSGEIYKRIDYPERQIQSVEVLYFEPRGKQ